jgi:26S proteasome regulatory subunit N6
MGKNRGPMIEDMKEILRNPETSPEEKEIFLLELFKAMISRKEYTEIASTICDLRSVWKNITTARVTKIIKRLFDVVPYLHEDFSQILGLLDTLVSWAERDGKKMLKLDLECKRIYALLRMGRNHDVLKQTGPVIRELKKYEDKLNLITIFVYESKAFYETRNVSRSKSSLTSARALAVSAYCPSKLQAQIDLLSGMYICDDRNYSTAFSYFMEALEGFSLDKAYEEAAVALRYLVMSKILARKLDEIGVVMKNKHAQRHLSDRAVTILLEIGESCKNRDLKVYSEVLSRDSGFIREDPFICSHLEFLYDILLENNIIKIIEPYADVRIEFIASKLDFDSATIESKLRKMILDRAINGILDHVNQCLILHEEKKEVDFIGECIQQIDVLDCIASSQH